MRFLLCSLLLVFSHSLANAKVGFFHRPLILKLFAGNIDGVGSIDGLGVQARLHSPIAMTFDASGTLFVADQHNHTIRKVSSAGEVTTIAGSPGASGSTDGPSTAARFFAPAGIAIDASGNIYVSDYGNHTIRKITSGGTVSTIAGAAGTPGGADGVGTAARFNSPAGLAIDASGNIFVADSQNHTIRKIASGGIVTTVAGTAGSQGMVNATGAAARFYSPEGIAVDNSGVLYVSDTSNNRIRQIATNGAVTTLAGSGTATAIDATGTSAGFYRPNGLVVDASNNLYVGDAFNFRVRKVTSAGVVTTVAGNAVSGHVDAVGTAAKFVMPMGIALHSGFIYVGELQGTIRKITVADSTVATLAGKPAKAAYLDNTGAAARFADPTGVAVDSSGNIFVADKANSVIRKITSAGVVSTFAGSAGVAGSTDGTGASARFNNPYGLAIDTSDNLYVSDFNSHVIRKITPGGTVTTLAGGAGISGSTDGTGTAARFNAPAGLTVDSSGNVFVVEYMASVVRKITPAGVVTTLAGSAGVSGSADGTGTAARFNTPTGITTNGSDLFVTDKFNRTIRKVTSAGVVTTLAGSAGSSGHVEGIGSAARFFEPTAIAIDAAGMLYVADAVSFTIRKVDSVTGQTSLIAGQPKIRSPMLGPLPSTLAEPVGIAIRSGRVYFTMENGIVYFQTPP